MSWDVLSVRMFGVPCLRLQVPKLSSGRRFLEETVTQLCPWAPGERGLYLRWIREGIFVFYFWGMTTAVGKAASVLLRVNWKRQWQGSREGDWRLLVLLWARHIHGSSWTWGPLPVHCVTARQLLCRSCISVAAGCYAKPLCPAKGLWQRQRYMVFCAHLCRLESSVLFLWNNLSYQKEESFLPGVLRSLQFSNAIPCDSLILVGNWER